MPIEEVPPLQIAVRLKQAMDQEGLSLHDMAREFELTYEYIRRLVRGLNAPSPPVLKLFAARFKWNLKEVSEELVQDHFRLKHGPSGAVAQKFNPEVEPFEKGWHLLEDKQKEILKQQFMMFLEQNSRHTRGGVVQELSKPAKKGTK